ncbi:MAG TPA: ABC transporter permease [Fimbriimonas sp.]|nr:ABC transporter permease [Fimbriimonas sp.]
MKWTLIVFRKEWRDMIRDKRIRSSMFMGPIFSTVLMFAILGFVMSSVKSAQSTTIHIVKGTKDAATQRILDTFEKAGMKAATVDSVEAGQKMVKEGTARLVVDFGTGLEEAMKNSQAFEINTYSDGKEQKAQIALGTIEKIVSEVNNGIVKEVLKSKGVPEAFSKPMSIKRNDVTVGESKTGDFLVQILPYIVIIWAFFGAMSAAGDIVSGEKEKQTLETLLISPAPRSQVAFGKLLALITASVCAVATSLGSMFVVSSLNIPILKPLMENGIGITPVGFVVVLLTLLPTSALFGSLLLAISSFARNTREAQSYLAQASTFVMLPAAFSQFIGLTEFGQTRAVYAIPILNSANVLRNALNGKYDAIGILITIGIGLLLAGIGVWYSVKMFHRESILNRI